MTRTRILRRATLLLLILAFSAGVWAQSPPASQPQDRRLAEKRNALPDSVRRVERETGGEVLRAEPMQRDGREVYRLKVLTADGRVRVMQDDPEARRDDLPPGDRGDGNGNGGTNGNGDTKEKRSSKRPDGEPQ